jgi:uncharacterized protein with FMN-binding domain
MRRSVLALIGTVAGTALLVGAKLGTPPPGDPNAVAMDAAGPGDPGTDQSGISASGAAAPSASGPGASAATGTAGQSAGPAPTGAGRATAPAPSPAAGGLKNGTFTGAGAAARNYETVTVTITVSGGKITVATGSCGNASGESRSICQNAVPKLQQATLTKQSASISTVSGATYTSNAYKTSLQSALDKAKA